MSPRYFRILPTAVVAFLTQLISGLFDLLTGVGTAMMYTLHAFQVTDVARQLQSPFESFRQHSVFRSLFPGEFMLPWQR